MQQQNQNMTNDKPDTLGLLESILKELGCQLVTESENSSVVAFGGENFRVIVYGEWVYITHPGWGTISVNDSNFENMKLAANIVNHEFGPSIVYGSPDKDGTVWVHTKMDILLTQSIQYKKDYVREVFNLFFAKEERFRDVIRSLQAWPLHQSQQTRPVGFTVSEEDEVDEKGQ